MAVAAKALKVQVNNVFDRILSSFPNKFSLAFAYGSGIFQQEGHKDVKSNMMDFIFAVDDPLEWHRENIRKNSSHYSFLKYGGPRLVEILQKDYRARVYFNTLVPFENRLIKYGVIDTKQLITDLLEWETLYISGRLHKPVLFIKKPIKLELLDALQVNLQNALHTALLMLPEYFSEEELFKKIASLSYTGDFRMLFGEDKNKVSNIVTPQKDRFLELYEPILQKFPDVHWHRSASCFHQDCSPNSLLLHLNFLPRAVQHRLYLDCNTNGRYRDQEDVLQILAHELDCGDRVSKAVQDIVWKSSWFQSMKGILTAGVLKSARYSAKKVKKMLGSLQKKR